MDEENEKENENDVPEFTTIQFYPNVHIPSRIFTLRDHIKNEERESMAET